VSRDRRSFAIGGLREFISLPENATRRRPPVRALINESAAAGALLSERADRLALALESRLASGADGEVLIDTEHQRMLAITVSPMGEGGAVLLFEDVTDRQIAEAKIHQWPTSTRLPNRAFLHDQTEAALAARKRRGPFATLFVDLDDCKQVNATLGHTCGDALLCAVARPVAQPRRRIRCGRALRRRRVRGAAVSAG
jgi:predicted signal transduction protein with EAL and GGDEF domain